MLVKAFRTFAEHRIPIGLVANRLFSALFTSPSELKPFSFFVGATPELSVDFVSALDILPSITFPITMIGAATIPIIDNIVIQGSIAKLPLLSISISSEPLGVPQMC